MIMRIQHALCAFFMASAVAVAVGVLPATVYADAAGATSPQLTTQATTAKDRLADYLWDNYYDDNICEFKYLNSSKTRGIGVTGTLNSDSCIDYWDVWYVNGSKVKRIFSRSEAINTAPIVDGGVKLYKVTGGKIFKIETNAYGSSSWSYAWFIGKSGSVKMIPHIGMDMKQVKGDEFSVVRDAFDIAKSNGTWTGHSYNAYYYRWTGKKFVEYGGKALTVKQFKRAKNGAKILNSIEKKVWKDYGVVPSIDQILYRSNKIVSVNYSFKSGGTKYCYNVTLKLSSGVLHYVKVWSYGANSLAKATQGGKIKKRGGSRSGDIGVSWPSSIPRVFRR